MTLARYQIRNEYGLADKELYQSTDKKDAEALLEGSSMAGLVGLLRQLGDLAEFAGEIFHNLHEELMTTSARGRVLSMRLQQLEAEVPNSIEIPILPQTDHSTYFYDPGLEWHSTLQTDENLISPSKLPHCIMDSYEECRAPPQLSLLDKFDAGGSGSCLKRYSDSSLLKTLTASSVLATSKLSKDERPGKTKKKVSHTSYEERLGDSQTSHAKLHQLFLVEHVEYGHNNPEFHVKLKRRHLNGPPINSSNGTGYMEKFLNNYLPYCARVHETLDQTSSPMDTEVTACKVQEDLSKPPLVYRSNGDTSKERDMESSIADDERIKIPYVEGGPVTEAKEADGDAKAGGNIRQLQICANADVTQTQDLSQFPNVLYHSSEERESTQVVVDVSEGGTNSVQTDDAEDDHSQHVFNVETESEMSFTDLVEDQFSSLTNQETEKESDCLLIQSRHVSTFDNFEDFALDVDAVHDSAVPKEDETNSPDRSSKNTEHSGHISTFEVSSQNGTLMSDTRTDLDTGTMNLLGSSWQEDALVIPDVAEISSDCGKEDPETMSSIPDGSSELEVQILDTQKDGTVFAGDNQTSLNDKASETMPEVDLEKISDPQESLLGSQECLSPEYHIETHGQGEESPSETESEIPTAAAESLPSQDVPLGVQCSPSEEIEAVNALDQGTITSLNGKISETVLSMHPIDQENFLDMPMSPFSTYLHETPQEDLEVTPPLPPLPPTQWWMGKLVESVKTTETQFSSVPSLAYNGNNSFYIHRDENTHNGLVQDTKAQDPSEASVTEGENYNSHVQTVEAMSTPAQATLNEPSSIASKEEQSPSGRSFAWESLLTPEATAEAESTEGVEALEWFSQNLKKHTNHNLANQEEEPQLDHPLDLPEEPERDNNSYEQNEKVEKLPRDKGSFLIGIDKSMLRKVSERNRTQLGARVEENDSLLEIIRSKSFNLRPAEASVRHNFQVAVPTTNLKVAAILEKANSLRHAMAGSDDDHDSDSWSE